MGETVQPSPAPRIGNAHQTKDCQRAGSGEDQDGFDLPPGHGYVASAMRSEKAGSRLTAAREPVAGETGRSPGESVMLPLAALTIRAPNQEQHRGLA